MRNKDLNSIWNEIEQRQSSQEKIYQKIIYVDFLFRVYIGSSGIPTKRLLLLEIPKTRIKEFDAFSAPKGFTLSIGETGIKHEGYAACIIQATNSDWNDVFTIVAEDILDNLRKQREEETYIFSLKQRFKKWRDFFKDNRKNKLTKEMIVGLTGELFFMKELLDKGIRQAPDLWNGPIKAAQDFQGNLVAIEVKTASANSLEYVHISSEMQLDDEERDALFLVAYRLEKNDSSGITLPMLIQKVSEMLTEQQKTRFWANLICLGYEAEDAQLYNEGYVLKERQVFKIKNGFPRILRSDLPVGVMDINYRLALQSCKDYASEFDEIVMALTEVEDGEA